MIMRVASIDYKQYLTCLEYNVWGEERSNIKKWNVGDLLLFKDENCIRSIVQITGPSYEDDLLIWDNGFFPYRVPFKVIKEFSEEQQRVILSEFKKRMIEVYGPKYGWVILNKLPIEECIAKYLYDLAI